MVLEDRRSKRKQETNRAQKAIREALSALQTTQAPLSGGLGRDRSLLGLEPSQTLPDSPSGPISGNNLTEAEFNKAVQQLIAGSGGKITVTSGKRDTKRQAQLWEQALKKYGSESAARKWVAPPTGYKLSDGTIAQGSRHERGIASDLKYADDAIRQWAHENAKRYGLHFPLANEPWHVELLGSR